MKEKGQNRISIIVLLLASVVFLLLFYPGQIFHPNSYMFGTDGDAMKNYFIYASQINNDGLINSDMMNYPYSENILYLDCNPMAVIMIKVLDVYRIIEEKDGKIKHLSFNNQSIRIP